MKKLFWLGLALTLFAAAGPSRAQDSSETRTMTLYSPIPKDDSSRASVYLDTAAYAGQNKVGDVGYGFLWSGDERDWFKIPISDVNRGVIKDLGPHGWGDNFTVPWLKPLAKVKPGERRQLIDATAHGRVVDISDLYEEPSGKSKREGKLITRTRTTPDLIRAVLGHIYVVHVVDDSRDFYALLRVEALQRGLNCTISWKLVPSPQENESIK